MEKRNDAGICYGVASGRTALRKKFAGQLGNYLFLPQF